MIQTRPSQWAGPLLWLSSLSAVHATRHGQYKDIDLYQGSDLAVYVTRPDIRPPLWNITKHYPDEIAPGYWFVSPYADFSGPPDRTEYAPCQAGPHIYDGDGNLVWAGACLDHNRNVFDFRPFEAGNQTHLSYVLGRAPEGDMAGAKGMGIVLNSTYQETQRLMAPVESREFNLHEFQVINNGTTFLMISTHPEERNIYKKPIPPYSLADTKGYFMHDGVVEMDVATQEVGFQWWPFFSGVSYNESYDVHPPSPGSDGFWDFFHANSIDKTKDGDYVVSARHVNTIYKVYKKDSTIAWRLGGRFSDFEMDFNFSSQHDARVIYENSTTTILTFLDNASDDAGRQNDTSRMSSAKMVALDTWKPTNKTARLLHQWDRPDEKLTRKRGNVQVLDNENVLVCWSAQGYMSEHSADNRTIMEAKFVSPRFDTYRAYKANFVGKPAEPPVLKSYSFASDSGESAHHMMVSYVSWNGATEVKNWKFYGSSSATEVDSEAIFIELGQAEKKGFETMFTSYGKWGRIYVEGLDASGQSLGRSEMERPIAANNITSADTFHNPMISISKVGIWRETMDSIKKDPTLWIKIGVVAVFLTLLLQALGLVAYAFWRRFNHPTRGAFSRPYSADDDDYPSDNESEPMLEMKDEPMKKSNYTDDSFESSSVSERSVSERQRIDSVAPSP